MILSRTRKAQSILEYALLLGVIAAGILIMQSFIKRGSQGNLKDASDRMGEQFSASSTQISRLRNMKTDQSIIEESGTTKDDALATAILTKANVDNVSIADISGLKEKSIYNLNKRTGGDSTAITKQTTDAATQEEYSWKGYETLKTKAESNQADFQIKEKDWNPSDDKTEAAGAGAGTETGTGTGTGTGTETETETGTGTGTGTGGGGGCGGDDEVGH